MRIHIVPTYACNLKCDFCYATGFGDKYRTPMAYSLFMEVFNYYKSQGLKSISFLGGEPTMWPYLDYAINFARANRIETIIFSNGSYVNAIPDLAVLNITRFFYEPFSQVILNNINWYKDNKVQINFRINITRNISDRYLNEVLETARSVDAEIQFAAIDCSPYDMEFGDKIYKWLRHLITLSFKVRVSRPLLKCMFTSKQFDFIDQHCNRYLKCDFSNTVPVINPDGKTVYPCNSLTIPLPLKYVYSKRDNFKEIKYIQSNLNKIVPGECLVCEEYKKMECHGGCLSAGIKNLDLPKFRHKLFKPDKTGLSLQSDNHFRWDWGLAAKVIAKSIKNDTLSISGYVKLGYLCNNHCNFCTVEWQKGYGNRTYSQIKEEIDCLLAKNSIEIMHYSGGEPTLRKELPRILNYARTKGIKQQVIQTNGRILSNRKYLEELINNGATSFFVSLHGSDAKEHDSQVNAASAFYQTCKGLENLEKCDAKFSTNTVITAQNVKSLAKIIQFICREFPSVTKTKLSYPNLQGGASDNFHKLIVPLWDCIMDVKNAIYSGISKNVFVDTESIPVCLLGDLSDHACEFLQNTYNISDLHYREDGWKINNRAKNFIFYAKCSDCDVRNICCGIHPLHDKEFKYLDIFNPVSFDQIRK